MALSPDTRVKFTSDSRNGDWRKGDFGRIVRVLATPPQNQNVLYIVTLDKGKVWATDKDFEPNEQMTIFDALLPTDDAT